MVRAWPSYNTDAAAPAHHHNITGIPIRAMPVSQSCVLIVEAEAELRQLIAEALHAEGFVARQAANGRR
jgi:hypothetical protein